MSRVGDPDAHQALQRLFLGPQAWAQPTTFSLPGGQVLFDVGEPADTLYFVRTGRLGVLAHGPGPEPQLLGIIHPCQPAGEMAMIEGAPHTSTVIAMRDSEIMALPRAAFLAAAQQHPELMSELARLMIWRARHPGGASIGEPSAFGFVGESPGVEVRSLVEQIAHAITGMGCDVVVIGAEAASAPTDWFSMVEARHELVIYAAEVGESSWKAIVGRQVDRLFRVGRGGEAPAEPDHGHISHALSDQGLVDVVLLHPPDAIRPHACDAWLALGPATRLFHLREGLESDTARMARLLTGRSVGLVLSGGGARAYAHIGAIRALRQAGVPIDFVGGSSMGAIIGAGVAMGWDDHELDARIRAAFVSSSPLHDIALPMIAMTRGAKVRERMAAHFGETQIADLWLPFFCVSSDLTAGGYRLHRRGGLREALEASIALPGILPPQIQDGHVLVDGAVTKNFPADVMRTVNPGPVVGVDVTVSRGLTPEDLRAPSPLWRWLLSGDWTRGPPIVSILMRAATLSTGRELQAGRDATDLLITPDVAGVEIRNWKAYEPAVEAGFRAASEALARLTVPVTALRRQRTRAEAEAPVSGAGR